MLNSKEDTCVERLRRLRQVAYAYDFIDQTSSEESVIPEDDLVDYIESIKRCIFNLHTNLIEILEQA